MVFISTSRDGVIIKSIIKEKNNPKGGTDSPPALRLFQKYLSPLLRLSE
jgi:hypothetical protein